MKPWTLADLHRLKTPDAFQVCDVCKGRYSAAPGDYWALPDHHTFTCCGQPIRVVTQQTIYRGVTR